MSGAAASSSSSSVITTHLPLKLLAKGKVRDVYDAGIPEGQEHAGAILFVATDRISAFDVVLENVSSRLEAINNEDSDASFILASDTNSLPSLIRSPIGHPAKGSSTPCPLDLLVRPPHSLGTSLACPFHILLYIPCVPSREALLSSIPARRSQHARS